jgi:hypothetical protein
MAVAVTEPVERPVRTARRSRDRSSYRSKKAQRQEVRPRTSMSQQEKEELFQQFIAWQRVERAISASNR